MRRFKWKPLVDLGSVMEVFPQFAKSYDLAADIYEEKDDLVVQMQVAGVDPDHVEIEVDDNVLTVRGSRKEIKETADKHYYRKELCEGAFERTLLLPVAVVGDQAKAIIEHGILRIVLPKELVTKSHKISVTKPEHH